MPSVPAMTDFPHSLIEFQQRFGDEAACAQYLAGARWPDGFICPGCGGGKAWRLENQTLDLRMCQVRSAGLGHRRNPHAPFQAAAYHLVLGRLSDGDPLQRYLGAAIAAPTRPRFL